MARLNTHAAELEPIAANVETVKGAVPVESRRLDEAVREALKDAAAGSPHGTPARVESMAVGTVALLWSAIAVFVLAGAAYAVTGILALLWMSLLVLVVGVPATLAVVVARGRRTVTPATAWLAVRAAAYAALVEWELDPRLRAELPDTFTDILLGPWRQAIEGRTDAIPRPNRFDRLAIVLIVAGILAVLAALVVMIGQGIASGETTTDPGPVTLALTWTGVAALFIGLRLIAVQRLMRARRPS